MIRKITDGYYFGKQEDLVPLLLEGAESGAVYFATDTGVIYEGSPLGLGKTENEGAPIGLEAKALVHKKDAKSALVFVRDVNKFSNGKSTSVFAGKKFRFKEIMENLLIKNSLFKETDETAGYTREGNKITFTGKEAIVKNLNVYADEVKSLAIVACAESDSLSSDRIKVGYIASDGSFVQIKSVGSAAANNYRAHREVVIEGAEAVPHRPLAIQITEPIANIHLGIYDEHFSLGYSNWNLNLLTRYGATNNITGSGTFAKEDDNHIIYFTNVDYSFQMSVLKATDPVKFINIGDTRYTSTSGDAEEFTVADRGLGWGFIGDIVADANYPDGLAPVIQGISGIVEVFLD